MSLISLPTEILQEVIIQVFLNDQDVPISEGPEYSKVKTVALLNYTKSKIRTNSFTSGILAVHDIKSSIKNPESAAELYDDFRNGAYVQHRDLITLSLTCHYLYNVVEQILWKMIEPGCKEGTQGSIDFRKILCTLFLRSGLGKYVKGLSFRYLDVGRKTLESYDEEWDAVDTEEIQDLNLAVEGIRRVTATSKTIEDIYDFIQCWSEEVQMAALVSLLPNLAALSLTVDSIPNLSELFNLSHCSAPFPSTLQNITELSIILEGYDYNDNFLTPSNSLNLISLFLLPNINTLYLGKLHAISHKGSSLEDISQYYHKSPVKELIFDFCHPDTEPAFDFLLRLPEALHTFIFTHEHEIRENRAREQWADTKLVYALLPQAESLKRLEIRGPTETRKGRDPIPVSLIPRFVQL